MEHYRKAWSVARSILYDKFVFGPIKAIAGHSGIDLTHMAQLEQISGSARSASKSQLLSAIDHQVGQMDLQRLKQFMRIIIEEMLRRKPEVQHDFQESLERLGWTLHDGRLVEIAVLDISELPEFPPDANSDLVKAATRLRDGDLSGAVSAASAAVDAVTSKIYHTYNMGDPGPASFQERVSRSLKTLNTIEEIERQLIELGWEQQDANVFAQNVRGSLNQAAFVMQTLRSRMGDVHGTKPILKPLVFDTIKWGALIVRFLT